MRDESATERLRFAWALTAAVFLATVPRLLYHELWRDEAWLWMVVGDSSSLADMAERLGRNGQGHFFPLLCYLAKQVSPSPRAMQFVNLVLASCGAFVFARWAPLGRFDRALFVLGYLPFYEYAVISRHYAAGGLLLWLSCLAGRLALQESGQKSKAWALAGLGVALGLLCQTTVYGFILAAAVAAGWAWEAWRRRAAAPLNRRGLAAGVALAAAGAIAGLFQLIPEAGTSYAPGWRFLWRPDIAERVLQMPWRAFVPLPRFELNFWNSNLLDAWPHALAAAGLLTAAAATIFLWPQKAAAVTFCCGAAGLATFGYLKFVGVVRHDGHWWLLFAAALWIGGGVGGGIGGGIGEGQAEAASWRRLSLRALLVLHCAVGLFASWMDLRHPFSNAAAAARLIEQQGLDRYPLLGYREPPAAPVILALGKQMFAPSRGIYASYPDWGPIQRDLSPEELRCAARGFAESEAGDVVLVINGRLPPWREVEAAGAALGAIQATEDYHLYRLLAARLPETAAEAGCPPR